MKLKCKHKWSGIETSGYVEYQGNSVTNNQTIYRKCSKCNAIETGRIKWKTSTKLTQSFIRLSECDLEEDSFGV